MRPISKIVIAGMTAITMIVLGKAAMPMPAEDRPGGVTTAANDCSNPVLASNLNGWGSLDGSWTSRDPVGDLAGVSWAFGTGGRTFYMSQLTVAPGQIWTFSAKDRVIGASGTSRIAVDWYNASGQYIQHQNGTDVNLPASTGSSGTWTTVSHTFSVPTGAVTAHVLQAADFGSATGTIFKATQCFYELQGTTDSAAARYGWGAPEPSESDEYNATAIDTTKWGLFGTSGGQQTGCSPGFQGHGQRCSSQTKIGGGLLSVTGTDNGITGGLYSRHGGFKYGRVEIRERAIPLANNGGAAYHVVPLLFPQSVSYTLAEIDFAERDVATQTVHLFVHHDGTQTHCQLTIDSTQFHNYAVDWQPNSVTWYVDGNQICVVNEAINAFNTSNGGAQMDMFPPSGTLMRPARQDIDWIRMYPIAATVYN